MAHYNKKTNFDYFFKSVVCESKRVNCSKIKYETVEFKKQLYIGLSSVDFKTRLAIHEHSFRNPDDNQTALSTHILELKSKNTNYQIKWKLIGRARPFSPVTGKCALCIKEKYCIMFKSELADLNSKSEIYSNCRHKQSELLVKKARKKKNGNNIRSQGN